MMDVHIHGIEEGANASTNASPRPSCLTPDRQALADSMMESITASVSKLRRGDPPTIYKVPQTIRKVKKVAYEPQIVSIGPYHNGKKNLRAMEEHKWVYLHSFLSRNTEYKLEHYLKAMSEWEDEARSCYYDNVDQHLQVGNEFVKMMVLDACFIVELFLRQRREKLEQNEENLCPISAIDKLVFHSNGFRDPMLDKDGMVYYTTCDMLLLENQIPFFVLQRIFEMAFPVNVPHALEKLALDFFDGFFDGFMPRNKKIEIKDSYYHLLHLFHSHLLPTPTDHGKEEHNLLCNPIIKYVNKLKNPLMFFPCSNESQLPITEPRMMIPCATDLQLAGVKFKKNEKSNNILNVKFSHGVLEIPLLLIHDQSDTLFRNLLAFEQCCLKAEFHFFASYIKFMDFLVNTSKDVALLHHNGIIDNYLGSDDDVAHLFNRLGIGIFEGSNLSDVKDNLRKHCKNKWNMRWASLKRKYFSNPWSVISLIAAVFLLALTIAQTIFTVYPYYRPQS